MFATSRISLASSSVSKMATLLWWAGGSVTLAGCSWAGTEMLCSTAKGMYTDGEEVRRCVIVELFPTLATSGIGCTGLWPQF